MLNRTCQAYDMVGIVKWLRPRVVAPVYVGSNPTTHPIPNIWRHSQVVRQRSAKPLFPSSNLGVASICWGIAKR